MRQVWRCAQQMLEIEFTGKRKSGRSEGRFLDVKKEDMEIVGVTAVRQEIVWYGGRWREQPEKKNIT